MRGNFAVLRSKLEADLAKRIPAPFAYRDRKAIDVVSAGIPEIDSLAGGLPRGGLTEICGLPCSGGTSLLVSALAARTASSEVCALIDGCDSFDPHSAKAAGVELQQLLWVRCQNIDQALRATDLLIQGGGFGLIALDLSGIPCETVRYVPLNVWFRFRRAVENTPSILMILEQESNAKTCASLVLQLTTGPAHWLRTLHTPDIPRHSASCLLNGLEVRADILRSRVNASSIDLKTGTSNEPFPSNIRALESTAMPAQPSAFAGGSTIFNPTSMWSFPENAPAKLKNDDR
jgi:recombination protein RecA